MSRRFLAGYGPLPVLVCLLVLMAGLAPSRPPAADAPVTAVVAGPAPSSGAGPETATGPSPVTGGLAPEGTSAPASPGQTGTTAAGRRPGTATGCAGRADQVPGDPYSPPCIAWDGGDNGGATSRGVTATEITVSFRVLNERGFQQTLAELAGASLVDTPETVRKTVAALADYFNRRFQFYGRRLKIAFYDGKGSNTTELLGGGRDKAEADAITVASQIGAFADLSATSEPYANALARRGVIGFGTPYLSREWHEQRAPFAWSLATDGTLVSALAAEYGVKRLCGRPASYAGGDLAGRPRKFATLAPENSWYQESVENARRIFREGGCDPGVNRKYVLDLGTMSNQAANIIPALKASGVTTLFCGCDPILPVFLSGVANRERYYPEFIIVGTALTDTDIVGQLWDQTFASHAFGISSLADPVPPQTTIAYEAYKTVRSDEPAFSVDLIYYQMYMLAIGVQMAGPNLTPATFEQGMFRYPPRRGPVGLWKFGPGDRTAANDVREIYWDPDAVSTYNHKRGAYRQTSPARWEAGQIPAGEPGVPRR